ncbi:uncharacterized protein LOC116935433 isoform X1 [Daphnia magna]|uniref:uncharacterized protein LOC116935433 isoform X1 n=1 Tax=Daphnia magna TaxID=35525 RepID=UPI001E1BB5E8|nr:uncharacterized protein LOC116935433 isoform X1 [Daphnia magna]XP_045028013.1 uncharacterized protein LOC116935433 isoform X1 [Daphnia magna]XP_045028015.1 uncharacterized protein LOC116935433 isoform X1 [Daphnia magna]XP_045028016.1 uncharacterized protein LOC116935433 isoform X1 [Daphnia magna]
MAVRQLLLVVPFKFICSGVSLTAEFFSGVRDGHAFWLLDADCFEGDKYGYSRVSLAGLALLSTLFVDACDTVVIRFEGVVYVSSELIMIGASYARDGMLHILVRVGKMF